MFIIIVRYKRDLAEVDRYLSEHRAYLDGKLNEGVLITSGPQTPRIGGVIMINADSRAEAEAFVNGDPFHIHEIADYELVEFTATKACDPALLRLLK